MMAYSPRYLSLSPQQWKQKAERGRELLKACTLCPRRCGINRLEGRTGFCGQPAMAAVACAIPHHGEEPPLSGTGGAGTVFFSGCTMACLFCQNYQISQDFRGQAMTGGELARVFLSLQQRGCHNVELVSPTPHIPFIVEALASAREAGLAIPVVYNSNGYLSPEGLSLLEGLVDIYLPDIKYSEDSPALALSGVPRYVSDNRRTVEEMYRQAGDFRTDRAGLAETGMIVRILLLPGGEEGVDETLNYLARTFPSNLPISLMSQYTPLYRAVHDDSLRHSLTPLRRKRALKKALSLGLSNLWVQGGEAPGTCVPDFTLDNPFRIPSR